MLSFKHKISSEVTKRMREHTFVQLQFQIAIQLDDHSYEANRIWVV